MKVIIFGGTGFLGRSLSNHLADRGYECVQVARHRPPPNRHRFVAWDGVTVGAWAAELEGARAIVNLAGRTVDCIKTPDHQDEILRSRVDSCRAIGAALRATKGRPPVWVQMSTAHIYGDPPKQVMTEDSAFGYGLAPTVGKAWEKAYLDNLPEGMRDVRLRTSFVVGRGGGALEALRRITRMGLGGTAGGGTQGMSWLHEFDMNEIFRSAIEDESFVGPYIASAPEPVSNETFMRELRLAMGVPFGLPAPEMAIRFGATYFFRTDPELVLYGRYVVPRRLLDEGFRFRYSDVRTAFSDLVG